MSIWASKLYLCTGFREKAEQPIAHGLPVVKTLVKAYQKKKAKRGRCGKKYNLLGRQDDIPEDEEDFPRPALKLQQDLDGYLQDCEMCGNDPSPKSQTLGLGI